MRIAASVLSLLAATAMVADANPPAAANPAAAAASQVTLPLDDYQSLREANERPAATVVDTIAIAGSFKERSLTITFSGQSLGKRPQAEVLDSTNDVTIAGCSGAAILTRTAKGAFALIPAADKFQLRCDLRLSGSDRLQMHAGPAVLSVQSSVSDGELVAGDEDASGGRAYSLVREVAGGGERLAATATGRYRITLLPDATRFNYAIDVHNPNRSTSTLSLQLASNEHLQQIDSAAPYEADGTRYVFTIPPGDSSIAMTGELRGTTFRAPVDASLQYLVIESHPLIRPAVVTPAKRVSIAETGITPQYRGALAYETGKQQIEWKVTRLEALSAISYAANTATHRFFVPLDGPILGESVFEVRNEGAAELVLPRRPEPTFVSLQDQPVLMTKNHAGQLTVPLSTGVQTVLEQHRQLLPQRFGVGIGRIVVPQLDVPASRTTVVMSYPDEWIPLYEGFSTRSSLWTPEFSTLLLFLAIAIWTERLLAWLAFAPVRRMMIALFTGLASAIVFPFLIVVIVAAAALTIAWITTLPLHRRVLPAVAIIVCVIVVLGLTFVSRFSESKYEIGSSDASMTSTSVARNVATDTVAPKAEAPMAYQGLPAKFELPSGAHQTAFSQELLRVDREQSVFVAAISMVLVKWFGILIAAAVVWMFMRDRRRIAEAVRDRLAGTTVTA